MWAATKRLIVAALPCLAVVLAAPNTSAEGDGSIAGPDECVTFDDEWPYVSVNPWCLWEAPLGRERPGQERVWLTAADPWSPRGGGL